jgi:5-methylcytosine-specific restriction endonuclease McrA
MHHKVPRDEGGPDTIENLMALCGYHHTRYTQDVKRGRRSTLRDLVEIAARA